MAGGWCKLSTVRHKRCVAKTVKTKPDGTNKQTKALKKKQKQNLVSIVASVLASINSALKKIVHILSSLSAMLLRFTVPSLVRSQSRRATSITSRPRVLNSERPNQWSSHGHNSSRSFSSGIDVGNERRRWGRHTDEVSRGLFATRGADIRNGVMNQHVRAISTITPEQIVAALAGVAVGIPVFRFIVRYNNMREIRNNPSQYAPKRPSEQVGR